MLVNLLICGIFIMYNYDAQTMYLQGDLIVTLNATVIYIVLAIIVLAIIVVAALHIKDTKRSEDVETEDRSILDALLDEIREKEDEDVDETASNVDVARQQEIEDKLREEQDRYADETRRLNEENEKLKRQLEESAKYTKQLDMRHMQRAIQLAEQNKSLKEQISKLRTEYSSELEAEKKEFAKNIEEEKKEFIKQYAVAHQLSNTAQMDLETQRRAFSKKLKESKAIVSQQLDNTYEEVSKLVENERLELLHKQDIERLEIAQRNNTEKGAYRKMLADLNEENTALEKQLDEERLAYAQKLYEARKNFETRLKAEKISNAKLVAAVAQNVEEYAGYEGRGPEPVEVDPEVTITSYAEPEAIPYMRRDKKEEQEPQKDSTKLIFAEEGVVNLKLVMKDSVKKLEAIVRKYGVGISLQFGEMPDPIVYADSKAINTMAVSLVYDVAEAAYRNSTIVMFVRQLGASKYGRGEYEYSCTYVGDPVEMHLGPINALNGSYETRDNDDRSKTVTVKFRFELR